MTPTLGLKALRPLPFQRLIAVAAFIFGLALTVVTAIVVCRGTLPGADSIMYALPLAERMPGSGLPLIGNFPPYSESWGHHWPGGLVIRLGIFSIMPYSRQADLFVFFGAVYASACFTYWGLRQIGVGLATSLAAALLILCEPKLFSDALGLRFEPFAGLGVSLFIVACASAFNGGKALTVIFSVLGAFLAFSCHPFSGVAAVILGLSALLFALRGEKRLWPLVLAWLLGGLLSCLFLAFWFGFISGTWDQLDANLKLQATFWHDRFVLWMQFGVTRYPLGIGYLYLCTVLLTSFVGFYLTLRSAWASSQSSAGIVVVFGCAAVSLGLIVFYVASASVNDLHLLCLLPSFAGTIAAVTVLLRRRRKAQYFFQAILFTIASAFFVLNMGKIAEFLKLGRPNIPAEAGAALRQSIQGNQFIISPGLWSGLNSGELRRARLWTFSVASKPELRKKYEEALYGNLRKGEMLFAEESFLNDYDPFGVLPTFSRKMLREPSWKDDVIYSREGVGSGRAMFIIHKFTYLDGEKSRSAP